MDTPTDKRKRASLDFSCWSIKSAQNWWVRKCSWHLSKTDSGVAETVQCCKLLASWTEKRERTSSAGFVHFLVRRTAFIQKSFSQSESTWLTVFFGNKTKEICCDDIIKMLTNIHTLVSSCTPFPNLYLKALPAFCPLCDRGPLMTHTDGNM